MEAKAQRITSQNNKAKQVLNQLVQGKCKAPDNVYVEENHVILDRI
jgi:hypothetical protein